MAANKAMIQLNFGIVAVFTSRNCTCANYYAAKCTWYFGESVESANVSLSQKFACRFWRFRTNLMPAFRLSYITSNCMRQVPAGYHLPTAVTLSVYDDEVLLKNASRTTESIRSLAGHLCQVGWSETSFDHRDVVVWKKKLRYGTAGSSRAWKCTIWLCAVSAMFCRRWWVSTNKG